MKRDNPTPRICLYGVDSAESTRRAQANLTRAFSVLGLDGLTIEFVDVIRHPQRTFEDGVLVTPTLIVLTGDRRHVIVGTVEDPGILEEILSGRAAE
ncbi:MAG: circadian clock KaiB family protein [Rhodospirillales bacterium]